MAIINISKIIFKHKKGWIALSPDNRRLIATGETLKEVLKKAKREGIENPSVFKSAPVGRLFAG